MKYLQSLALIAIMIAAVSVSVSAQACSDLTIGGTQTGGGDVTFNVTGASMFSPVFLLGSATAGPTDIGGVITLGIESPLIPFWTMFTDMTGTANSTITLPPMLPPNLVGFDIYVQALSLDFAGTTATPSGNSLPFGICLSDVESFQLN
ncbi:MAG: hypothetical protein ACI97A_003662 [Planctomycetota bacterium]|jgi:hypothetical protein